MEGVVRLLKFAENNYSALFGPDNFKVVLINSHSDEWTTRILKEASASSWVSLCNSSIQGSLKDALWSGWIGKDKTFTPDIVHITETDASPNISTFKKMLHVFFEEERNQIASVTPVYSWQGKDCYPTHSHWKTDKLYKRHPLYGIIRNVGGPGVPFLYSLWKPSLLQSLNQAAFPPFIGLDGAFGNYVHKLGYKHLRLMGSSIDHVGGGRKSRTKPQTHQRRKSKVIKR